MERERESEKQTEIQFERIDFRAQTEKNNEKAAVSSWTSRAVF